MQRKEHDIIETKDGRKGTIVHIFKNSEAYVVEFSNPFSVKTIMEKDIKKDEIEELEDDSQFEEGFELDEEYNYKEKKFEVGDKVKIWIINNKKWSEKEAIITNIRNIDSNTGFDLKKIETGEHGFNTAVIFDLIEEDDDSQFEEGFELDENKKFKKYGDFIMEKYKLIIADEPKTEFGSEDWTMILDVSDLWRKFDKNQINLVYFIDKYKELLQSKKDEISQKTSPECWNKMEEIINKFDVTDKESVYSKLDEIYDIADKYGIKIKT